MTVCPVTAILDSGADLTMMSASVTAKLQVKFPAVKIVGPMASSQQVRVADGCVLKVSRSFPGTDYVVHKL